MSVTAAQLKASKVAPAQRSLFASVVQSMAFVSSLKALETLKFRDLKDGDLTARLHAPALKKVDFHPQKKHYSHSKEQINSLLNP